MMRTLIVIMAVFAFSPALSQQAIHLPAEEVSSRAAELEGQIVLIEDGRIFAAAADSAVLKIGSAFLALRSIASSDDLQYAWEHCGGVSPVDECRVAVTGTLVTSETTGEPELHEVSIQRR